MDLSKKLTFDRNTMATTVGANSLNVETVVSQPCSDQVDLMVDGLDYVFDQAKFEDYLSSSSKSSSPRKHRRTSTSKREVRSVIVRGESHNNTPANCKAGSSADSIPVKESPSKVSVTLSRRARQRQRQKAARKLAKAMESTDGVRYYANLTTKRHQTNTVPQPQIQTSNASSKEEWIPVKRTRLTKKERAQRRRARAARAREIIRKAQEAKGSNRKVWIPKSGPNLPRKSAASQGRGNRLANRAAAQTAALIARQSQLPRQPRGSPNCRADASSTRDISNRLGKREAVPDTFNCPGQTSSSPLRPSTSPADVLPVKPEKSTSVFNRLGPVLKNQDKAPVHKRLGHARRHTGGRAQNLAAIQKCPEQAGTSQDSRLPVASRLSIPQGVRETVVGKNSKRAVIREVTRDDNTIVIHARNNLSEKRPKVSSQHPQRKTCHQKDVTLGGGSLTHHQAEGDNTRKRTIDQIDCSCSCAHLIKTLLSGCACSESKSFPQRASVFGRLSLPMTEESTTEESRPG